MPPELTNAAGPSERRRSTVTLGTLLLMVAVVLAACVAGTSAPTSTPADARTGLRSAIASASPSEAPALSPPPLHALPDGWEVIRDGAAPPFDLVVDSAYLGANYDTQSVTRIDPETLEALDPFTFGTEPGAFPPDVQTIAPGTGGVWVTLASQGAVVLIDPASGTELRRIELDGQPYSVVEDGDNLWVADYELNLVFRVDLRNGEVMTTIRVQRVTDLAVGGGAVWATVHTGRRQKFEPIEDGGQIARIDPETNDVTLIDVGPRPYFLAVGFGSVWTGNATGGSVSRIDMATNEPTTIPIFQDGAFDIEVVGDSVWVVVGPQHWAPECRPDDSAASFFVRIDPSSNAVERVAFPCPFGVTPAGDGAWVSGLGDDGWITRLLEPSS